jgi:hypothetical protein
MVRSAHGFVASGPVEDHVELDMASNLMLVLYHASWR